MKHLLQRILARMAYGPSRGGEPALLDHIPVPSYDPADPLGTARARKLQNARERLGRAFKCAGPDQDREVIVAPGEPARIVKAGHSAVHFPSQPVIHLGADFGDGRRQLEAAGDSVRRLVRVAARGGPG